MALQWRPGPARFHSAHLGHSSFAMLIEHLGNDQYRTFVFGEIVQPVRTGLEAAKAAAEHKALDVLRNAVARMESNGAPHED